MSLHGKRALVTGASGALGSAIARRLAAQGASVLLHANSRPDAVQALAETIHGAGGQARTLVFDLGDDDGHTRCLRADAGRRRGADRVNNAGVHDDAVFPALRAEQWHRVIDVSLNGFFRVTQPLAAADAAHALGPHRQHLVGGGAHGQQAARSTTPPPRAR